VDDDCRALAAAWVSFVFAVVFPSGSPEQASALQRLADTVPAELEADVLTMAKGYRKFADNLADPDLDPDFDLVAGLAPRLAAGEIPSDEQIQAALAQMHAALRQSQTALAPYDAATKASGRVSTWVKENCTG
jgi:hypothetical protein